jgi:DNA-directed RNA polymerase subunit beta'
VKAGQTISEPLVQMVMNSRHTGGVAGTGAQVGGYQRIDQLLRVKSRIKGASPLSPKQGTITKVEKGLAGGYNVWVGDKQVHVPSGLELRVKKGDLVAAGDALAHGVIQPQDLVKHKGMMAAQTYIVDELAKTYQSQGAPLQKRVFETVVRSLGNTTQVLNNPKDSGYLPGDVVPYTVVQAHNRNLIQEKPVAEAEGYRLGEAIGGLRKGHVLEAKDLKAIAGAGVKTVKVELDPIVHAPFLKGMTTLPLLKRDWMSPLGYRYLSKSLVEGAGQGWTTDVAGHHPIPAIAHGATFGQGKDGKY